MEDLLEAKDLFQIIIPTEYKVDIEKEVIPFSAFTSLTIFDKKKRKVAEYVGVPTIGYFTDPENNFFIRLFLNSEQLKKLPKGKLSWKLTLVDVFQKNVGEVEGLFINLSHKNVKERLRQKLDRTGKTARPWDFVNPETKYVSEDISEQRLSTCEGCPFFTSAKTCEKCGCFMPLKTKLAHAECPIGKWHAEMI